MTDSGTKPQFGVSNRPFLDPESLFQLYLTFPKLEFMQQNLAEWLTQCVSVPVRRSKAPATGRDDLHFRAVQSISKSLPGLSSRDSLAI